MILFRSKSNQYPNTSLIQIEGVNTKEEVGWYAGKRMAYIYKAKVKKNGSHYRCIWGKVTRPHGNSGVVRAKFKSNLPPRSMVIIWQHFFLWCRVFTGIWYFWVLMHYREHELECSCIQATSEVISLSFVFLLHIWKHSCYISWLMSIDGHHLWISDMIPCIHMNYWFVVHHCLTCSLVFPFRFTLL